MFKPSTAEPERSSNDTRRSFMGLCRKSRFVTRIGDNGRMAFHGDQPMFARPINQELSFTTLTLCMALHQYSRYRNQASSNFDSGEI